MLHFGHIADNIQIVPTPIGAISIACFFIFISAVNIINVISVINVAAKHILAIVHCLNHFIDFIIIQVGIIKTVLNERICIKRGTEFLHFKVKISKQYQRSFVVLSELCDILGDQPHRILKITDLRQYFYAPYNQFFIIRLESECAIKQGERINVLSPRRLIVRKLQILFRRQIQRYNVVLLFGR